ncbi:LysR family transcriptional regulator, partial [Butyricicoccus sp. 1XD8-22]
LLEYTKQIMGLMDEAKSVINPTKWRESLMIGASQTVSAVKIPQLLSSFLREHKHIDVKIRTNNKQRIQEMLSYGELDGIFINS